MAQRRVQAPSDTERGQVPRSGEQYGAVRGYGIDNGEADEVARTTLHGAHPEPPRERGCEYFEEQE